MSPRPCSASRSSSSRRIGSRWSPSQTWTMTRRLSEASHNRMGGTPRIHCPRNREAVKPLDAFTPLATSSETTCSTGRARSASPYSWTGRLALYAAGHRALRPLWLPAQGRTDPARLWRTASLAPPGGRWQDRRWSCAQVPREGRPRSRQQCRPCRSGELLPLVLAEVLVVMAVLLAAAPPADAEARSGASRTSQYSPFPSGSLLVWLLPRAPSWQALLLS